MSQPITGIPIQPAGIAYLGMQFTVIKSAYGHIYKGYTPIFVNYRVTTPLFCHCFLTSGPHLQRLLDRHESLLMTHTQSHTITYVYTYMKSCIYFNIYIYIYSFYNHIIYTYIYVYLLSYVYFLNNIYKYIIIYIHIYIYIH